MKEKLYFLGMLILSVLYCIEVIPEKNYGVLNYIAFVIVLITIIPWLISILISVKKKSKAKAEERETKNALAQAKAKEKAEKLEKKRQKEIEKNKAKFK